MNHPWKVSAFKQRVPVKSSMLQNDVERSRLLILRSYEIETRAIHRRFPALHSLVDSVGAYCDSAVLGGFWC